MGEVISVRSRAAGSYYASSGVVSQPSDSIIYSASSEPVVIRSLVPFVEPDVPVFDSKSIIPSITTASGTFSYNNDVDNPSRKYSVQSFSIQWDPVESITYYQVFFIENGKTSFDWSTENKGNPLNSYLNAPMFTNQSDPISVGTETFTFTYPILSKVYKVNAFVFAYNSFGRSAFPLQMVSFIGENQKSTSIVNSCFLEYTDYYLNPGWFLYSDSSPSTGLTSNIKSLSDLTQHPYYYIDVPNDFDFSLSSYILNRLYVIQTDSISFVVTGGIRRDSANPRISIALDIGHDENLLVDRIYINEVSYTVIQDGSTFYVDFESELLTNEETIYRFDFNQPVESIINVEIGIK
jgi:hypothetical protein